MTKNTTKKAQAKTKREADTLEALETAKQVKGWSKYDQTDVSYGFVFWVGILLGVVVSMILVTPAILALV